MSHMDPDAAPGFAFKPARRDRARARQEPVLSPDEEEQADLERGRSAALLSTLGRMQLRLDVLERQQREGFAAIESLLAALAEQVRSVGEDAGTDSAPMRHDIPTTPASDG